MSNHVIDGLSDDERNIAKSWATNLLHNAPQTEKFFNPNISLSEIKSRHEQKKEARDRGDSLRASETAKYFERSSVTTINKNLRPFFNQFMEFAYKGGNRDANSAVSPKVIRNFLHFQEDRVYSREITPDTFKEYASRIRILASMATVTKGFQELPIEKIEKMTQKSQDKVKAYVEEMKNTDNPVINDKHKIRAYTGDELERIINRLEKDGKGKMAASVRLISETAFRIENATSFQLNTQWKRVGYKKYEREYTMSNKIAIVSKGNQRHTVTLSKELFDLLKQYVDSDGRFILKQDDLRNAVKEACKKEGIEYISIHALRATVAYRMYRDLKATGYSEQDALQIVSNQLYHGRPDITLYYIRSAEKTENSK